MTRQINAGGVRIGGGAPVSIQSMLNTATTDVEGSLAQIAALKAAGCELARLAVPDQAAAKGFAAIAARSPLPLVADIHFDYRLAIAAAEGGAAKIRINPGNIGGEAHVRAVADCCRAHHIPIRIGVNGGSLEKSLLEKYGHPTPEALVESAFSHIRMLEDVGFGDICVSMKSSNVPLMMQAYRLMHERSDYPLHVGVTETGTEYMGTIKSAMGIGGLLCLGIGDTIRVSLMADPVREVVAAKAILKAAGLRKQGVNLISCPTCGRTKIDLIGLANRVQEALQDCDKELTVAVMGCVVNGPGEAREADIGIAGGDGCGVPRATFMPALTISVTGAQPEASFRFETGQCTAVTPRLASRRMSSGVTQTQWAAMARVSKTWWQSSTCAGVRPFRSRHCSCSAFVSDRWTCIPAFSLMANSLSASQRR